MYRVLHPPSNITTTQTVQWLPTSLKINRRSIGFSRTTFASYGLSQEEILQHELPFPSCKRTTADLARYLAIIRLRPSFNFDHLIERTAHRACEWIECTSRHGTPPANSRLLTYGTLVRVVAQPIRSINIPSSASAFELLGAVDCTPGQSI
jgi:hypothetical protein